MRVFPAIVGLLTLLIVLSLVMQEMLVLLTIVELLTLVIVLSLVMKDTLVVVSIAMA